MSRRMLMSSAIVVLAVAAAGCSTTAPATTAPATTGPASTAPATTGPVPNTGSATASGPAVAGCDTRPWQRVPLGVSHHVAVPPVPVVTAVRAAQHPECGYDRMVLDITGPVPSYSVRYVSRVVADPSGRPMTMPGRRYLLVTLRSAQAHTGSGTPTVTRGVQRPGYPALASWALSGDFEGVVTIALGVSGQGSIRVGELAGHLYVDVKE
jgi:hypothetical protein